MSRIAWSLSFILLFPTFSTAKGSLPDIYIGEISFEGNIIYSNEELRESLLLSRRGSLYLKDKLDYDLHQHLLAKYREEGYIMAKVGEVQLEPTVVVTKQGRKLDAYNIVIPIEEGFQFRYRHIDLGGVSIFDGSQILKAIDIEPEDIVNYKKMKAATELLRIMYRNEGFVNMEVLPVVEMRFEAKRVDVLLRIKEGELLADLRQ